MDEIKKNKKAADDEEADIQRELHKIRAVCISFLFIKGTEL